MRSVEVGVEGSAYRVVIGSGLLGRIGEYLGEVSKSKRVALITDANIANTYGVRLDIALAQADRDVHSLEIPAGEPSKSWSLAGELLEELAASRMGRRGVVVALGGGVVGDLAGFVSAVYLRGVDFVQVPTTLLAMVDSSVGGKTGVDLSAGKNLAGAFKQPLLVLADTDVLSTLPEREWLSGLAEVAKTAVLSGEEFLAWLEANADALVARDPEVVEETVARCVAFKASIVESDEKEAGPRECLNYGHTLGHALEKVAGYGSITHGAGVAEGMRFASRVAMEVGGADAAFALRQDRLLDRLGLAPVESEATSGAVLQAMKADKKVRKDTVRMVLADAPGQWECHAVPDKVLSAHLAAWAATKGGGSTTSSDGEVTE